MTSRRDALRAILASCVAPAFIPFERIMRIKPIVVPDEWGWDDSGPYPMQAKFFYEVRELLQASVNDARRRMIQDLSIWEPPNGS